MRAIETEWFGYRFRSRLEARWAVFFESLGWKWRYEHEGFVIGGGVKWLPDFEIETPNGYGFYVEVKGDPDAFREPAFIEALNYGRGPVGFLNSARAFFEDMYTPGCEVNHRGVLLLGDVPRPDRAFLLPVLTQHHYGVDAVWLAPNEDGFCPERAPYNLDWISYFVSEDGLPDFQPRVLFDRRPFSATAVAAAEARSARFEHGEKPTQRRRSL